MSPTWLTEYLETRGFSLLFYPTQSKAPTGPEAKEWQKRAYTADDYRDGMNVGVKLGVALTTDPSRYLVDLDFDYAEGQPMARRLLPDTGFAFGRASRHVSHAFYTTSQPTLFKSFNDIDGSHLIELRGLTSAGSPTQTMIPPSIHPSGEVIELRVNSTITHADDLERRVTLYAIACLLYKHIGHRGLLHEARLALAGFLLSCGVTEDETIAIGSAVAEQTGNSVDDVTTAARTTAQQLAQGNHRVKGQHALIAVIDGGGASKVGKKVIKQIRDWLHANEFITNDKDEILANSQENVRRALEKLDVVLYHDPFANRSIAKRNGYVDLLSDEVRDRAWLEIDEKFHFRPSPAFFDVVLKDTARRTEVHPVREYLDVLKWDGEKRLDNWLLTYGGAHTTEEALNLKVDRADRFDEYLALIRAVGSMTLIAAVRRVRTPGCKFDELLVLESKQGKLKSTALRALCPNEAWFSDDLPLNVDAKQIIERTAGKWIIEAAELSGMHRGQVEHLKALLSRQTDGPVRMAYDRFPINRDRQFIIVGTTNSKVYLKDRTGNRRFWPVAVAPFDVPGLLRDRDQLWAEAAHREAQGESIRLEPMLYGAAERQQKRRLVEDTWEDLIRIRFPDDSARITTPELFEVLGISPAQQDHMMQERLSAVMLALGFRRIAVRRKDGVFKGWGKNPEQPALLPEE